MKQINIREALLELDRKTDARYDLTTLYEACKLDDDDKQKLVKYIDAYDHPATINKFLSSKCDAITEALGDDDVSDMKIIDEINDGGDRTLWNLMDKFEDEDLQLKELKEDVDLEVLQSRLEDIEYAMNTYAKDSFFIDNVEGSGTDWKVTYNGTTVDVVFDTEWDEYTYTINGKGPYSHSSYEYIIKDIMDFVDYGHLGQSDDEVDEALGDNRDVHSRTHMDSYDVYCTDCGQVTSHRFKGNFKDGEKELGRYICKECGCENDDDPINESLTEGVDTSNLEPQIKEVVNAFMAEVGYEADEIEAYTAVEIKDTADDMIQVEVRAELGYDDLMELCDKLNPIVAALDPHAYFEPVTSGIARAFIRNDLSDDIADEHLVAEWAERFNACTTKEELVAVYKDLMKVRENILTGGTLSAIYDVVDAKLDSLSESTKLTLNESDDTDILYDMEDWDEDNTTVTAGNQFIEDGYTWMWFKQCGDTVHLDFDNWAVWWAYRREDEDDEDSAAISGFFVVDTDTGFIDWGPCDTVKEAQEFLQSKVNDWENDDLDESIKVGDKVKVTTPGNNHYDGRTGVVDYTGDGIVTVKFDDNNSPKLNNFDLNQVTKIDESKSIKENVEYKLKSDYYYDNYENLENCDFDEIIEIFNNEGWIDCSGNMTIPAGTVLTWVGNDHYYDFYEVETSGGVKRIPILNQDNGGDSMADLCESFKPEYWYFTKHGVQPGSIPKGANVLTIQDVENGTYVKLDRVLTTKELNDYEIIEKRPEGLDESKSINEDRQSDILTIKSNIKDNLVLDNYIGTGKSHYQDYQIELFHDSDNYGGYPWCYVISKDSNILTKKCYDEDLSNTLYSIAQFIYNTESKSIKEDLALEKIDLLFKELSALRNKYSYTEYKDNIFGDSKKVKQPVVYKNTTKTGRNIKYVFNGYNRNCSEGFANDVRDLIDSLDLSSIVTVEAWSARSYTGPHNDVKISIDESKLTKTNESKSIREDVNSAASSLFDLLKDYGAISVDKDVDVTRISFRNSEDDSDATLVHHCILSKGYKELNQYGNNPNVTEYLNEAGDTCVKLLIYDDSIAVELSAEDSSQYMESVDKDLTHCTECGKKLNDKGHCETEGCPNGTLKEGVEKYIIIAKEDGLNLYYNATDDNFGTDMKAATQYAERAVALDDYKAVKDRYPTAYIRSTYDIPLLNKPSKKEGFEEDEWDDDELASIYGGDTKYDMPDGVETPEETEARLAKENVDEN